ncbi:MAG TPA: ATP-binding protein [Dermatophilaceae bacterium]
MTRLFAERAHTAAGVWDALSPNRRLATTSAGAEMALVAAFLGLRAVNIVQLAASLPTGLTESPNPVLDALMVAAFLFETLGLALVALRRSSIRLPRLIWADVALGCVLLLGQTLISSSDDIVSWNAWGYAITLSSALAAGVGLQHRWETVLGAGALMVCYLVVTLPLSGSHEQLSTVGTNALAYVAFAGLGRAMAGYLRRLGSDADGARQQATILAVEAETERHRGLLHDQVTVLSLLSRDVTDARLQAALRQQAAVGATRIAAFMSGIGDDSLGVGTLGNAVRSAAVEFSDLPLTCTVDLAEELDVTHKVAEVVHGAVSTLLHNVRRHAGQASCVVHADADPVTGWWEVLVRDDGLGFTPETTPRGYGLERQVAAALAQIGVQVCVRSAPGEGTMVTLTHPGLEAFVEGSHTTPGKHGERSAENASTIIG